VGAADPNTREQEYFSPRCCSLHTHGSTYRHTREWVFCSILTVHKPVPDHIAVPSLVSMMGIDSKGKKYSAFLWKDEDSDTCKEGLQKIGSGESLTYSRRQNGDLRQPTWVFSIILCFSLGIYVSLLCLQPIEQQDISNILWRLLFSFARRSLNISRCCFAITDVFPTCKWSSVSSILTQLRI
jgi:hypothetical protein